MFFVGFGFEDPFGYGWGDRWYGRAEKSTSASNRERRARRKFDDLRDHNEQAQVRYTERIVQLGCKPNSPSLFRILPEVTVDMILEYAHDRPYGPAIAAAAWRDAARVPAPPVARGRKRKANDVPAAADAAPGADCSIDIEGLFEPGSKHVIPLLKPSCHLTGPCWRDFSRYVRSFPFWNVQRVKATPAEKRKHRETRKGDVYFVNAIYTAPGTPRKKIRTKGTKKRTAPSATVGVGGTFRDALVDPSTKKAPPSPGTIANVPPVLVLDVPNYDPTDAGMSARMAAARRAAGYVLPDPTDAGMSARMAAARRAAGYVLPGEVVENTATTNTEEDTKPSAKKKVNAGK